MFSKTSFLRQAISFVFLLAAWMLLWTLSLRATTIANTPHTADECGMETDKPYTAIDRYALDAPKSAEKSPEKLAAYLMRACVNDVEKARAVARWISANISYDYNALSGSAPRPSDHPDSVFASRRALGAGFANLYVKMLRSLGIEAVTITGVKKGFGYVVGDTTTLQRHVWNAFRVNTASSNAICNATTTNSHASKSQWYLVDVPVYKEVENSDGHYRTTYADAFFCIAPEQLALTHFPDNTRWQLTSTPVTREQFVKGVQYFGALYGHPVTPLSHKEYDVNAKQRTLVMEFSAQAAMPLGARIYGDGKELRNAVKWAHGGSTHTLTLKFPTSGVYKVEITVAEPIMKNTDAAKQVGCAVKTIAEYNVIVEGKALAAKE
jgi:hypothetical protein